MCFKNKSHWPDWTKTLKQPLQSPEVTIFVKWPSIDSWHLCPLDLYLQEKQQNTVRRWMWKENQVKSKEIISWNMGQILSRNFSTQLPVKCTRICIQGFHGIIIWNSKNLSNPNAENNRYVLQQKTMQHKDYTVLWTDV